MFTESLLNADVVVGKEFRFGSLDRGTGLRRGDTEGNGGHGGVLMVWGIIGRFVAPKPKGLDDSAQGLPWVSPKNVPSPEGAPGRECLGHDRKTRLRLKRNFLDRSRSRRRSRARFLKASIEWFALFIGIKSRTRTRTRTITIPAAWYGPFSFRADQVGNLTQGKLWAKFSWPFRPQRS
jgi:hypothetical protein